MKALATTQPQTSHIRVQDANGDTVEDLQKEDLALERQGVPVPITTLVRDSDNPISLGILIWVGAAIGERARDGNWTRLDAAIKSAQSLIKGRL